MCDAATSTTNTSTAVATAATTTMHHHQHDMLALDDLTANSSILEFLNQEQRCLLTDTARTISAASSARRQRGRDDSRPGTAGERESNAEDDQVDDDDDDDDGTELDIESIFEEIQRLSGGTSRSGGGDGEMPERSMEDILREAEALISKQERDATATAANWRPARKAAVSAAVVVRVHEDAVGDSGSSSGRATMTGRSEAAVEQHITKNDATTPPPDQLVTMSPALQHDTLTVPLVEPHALSSGSSTPASSCSTQTYSIESFRTPDDLPDARPSTEDPIDDEPTERSASSCSPSPSPPAIPSSPTHQRTFVDKSTAASPSHVADSFGRERALEHALDQLRETLKDTEERLHSMCLQHGTLAVAHRELRAAHAAGCAEADGLRRDVAQLNECAAALRAEVQTARADAEEARRVQQQLLGELQEVRRQRDAAVERRDRDAGSVQDLQRQCREMERILMRKHPDSVSALIVASKNPANGIDDQSASRRLLEQRIAQLEADAREQDAKAQQILANVQSRFSTVQSKYEQHIGDLETQVISLQQINARLNEKIAAHLNRNHQITATQACQTMDPSPEHDTVAASHDTSTQTNGKITGIHRNGTTTTTTSQIPTACGSRPGGGGGVGKPDCCHGVHNAARDDAHLMATLRGMRVDLAIKEKAMQRLTRDLDDCKRTMRKLQREKDALLKGSKKPPAQQQQQHQAGDFGGETAAVVFNNSSNNSSNDNNNHGGNEAALAEYLNRIRLLEFDYNALHDKRLQDLKTLQAAHERELASCQATVHILQQRLTDRDVAFDAQKRRELERNAAERQQQRQQQQQQLEQQQQQNQQQQQHPVPVDYMALKAKVSSLERRHSEREQRLHILVDALSKGGRLTGTPFDSNNHSSSNSNNQNNHNISGNSNSNAHGRNSLNSNGNSRMSVSAIPIMTAGHRDTETGCIGGRYASSSGTINSHGGSHTKLNKLPVRKCKV